MTAVNEFILMKQETGEAPVNTSSSSDCCRELLAKLAEVGQALESISRDTDPLFIRTGRDLQAVARESRKLTTSIQQAACSIGGQEGQHGQLDRSGQLIQLILERLANDRLEIEQDLNRIRDLVVRISEGRSINEAIDRIGSSFRAVRINIRIQCSAQLISDEMFKDVTEDIDSLSKSLTQITKQIKSDLSVSAKNLTSLERKVSASLIASERAAAKAKSVVNKAYADIRQLFLGTQNMIREAGRRAEIIAGKVDEIVVNIQFHDSLSQRTSHILQAFADVTNLCTPREQDIEPDALGTSLLILELQHRQLVHLIDEVRSIHMRVRQGFSSIGEEVKGLKTILLEGKCSALGSEMMLVDLSTSLQKALLQLCDLVAEGEGMLDQFKNAAVDTRNVAGRLVEIMQVVREMREKTRLQAVNTIIMASNLGERGRTIQVLAKEISMLSEQTRELVSDVELLQHSVNQKVENLCERWDNKSKGVSRSELEEEVHRFDTTFREVREECIELSGKIESSSRHIEEVYAGLGFIQKLQEGLWSAASQVEQIMDTLLPWKDNVSSDSSEINQLIQRYTMEQERLIHMFDRVEREQVVQSEKDIFF